MNKKILLTLMALITVSYYGTSFAQDSTNNVTKGQVQTVQQEGKFQAPNDGEFQGRPHRGEIGHGHHHGDMHKYHPSKAEMDKKKAEFEKRLKLTDEQKKQIEENRKLGHEQVKPIFDTKQAKMQEIRKIYKDNSLTQEQKQQKTAALKADVKKLDEQANSYREQNMQNFESILTEKQKKEFAKIKAEQKKDMEKRKAEFEKKMEKAKQEGKRPEGFPPPPPPVEE